MARNPILQIPCSISLHEKVENYKNQNSHTSTAEAGRELIEFALAIKERTQNDDSRTTRELLEEILAKEYQNETTLNRVYMHVFDLNKTNEPSHVAKVKNNLKGYKEIAINRLQKFLNREE
jgi:hypothetical protein